MRGVGRVQHLSVSPDGRFAYVAGFESMTVLRVTR
jgi:hypothetical protein